VGTRSEFAPGAFSWVDLATTETEAAKAFYVGLFGWEAEDRPGPGGAYTTLRLDGEDVAALYEQPEDQRSAGAPPQWNSYVTVRSADDAAARAAELGGTVAADPFDVMDLGREAVIADPTGAVVCVWEPRSRRGAHRVNDVGCLCWNELATRDRPAAERFYAELFGWDLERSEGPPPYTTVLNEGRRNGGIREMVEQEEGIAPHWLPYFASGDLARGVSRAQELGASLLAGPMDISVGGFAVVGDPQGAAFALFQGETDP
jgi:predicted enzyme related to lactoylglutathione lyase